MEAVAYIGGEQHSDAPECASPVIAAFLRSWNDGLPDDATRDRLLKALIPRVVGTVGTEAQESERSYMALDWLVRAQTPAWLDLAALTDRATALRNYPPITNTELATGVRSLLESAHTDAAAARAAAWAAASQKLQPTVEALQASALELIERMIAVTA